MIYLIKSASYDSQGGYIDLLKIGYTKDSKKDHRFMQYRLANPSCKVLYEIPDLTMEDEQKLHYYFRDLRYPDYGREWYEWSEEILDFFMNIEDYDISSLPRSPKSDIRVYSKSRSVIRRVIKDISGIPKADWDVFIERTVSDYLGSNNSIIREDNVLEYVRKDYGDDIINRYQELLEIRASGIYCEDPEINREVTDFLKVYESLTTIYDKLKLLCEYGLSPESINIVLGQIPDSDEIKSFYLALGPAKIKAGGYNISRIRKALGIMVFNEDILRASIYSDFHEGDRYLLSDLKDKLGILYKSISYNVTPKALDILNYFEVKEFMTTVLVDGSKKRVRGYELLKKKL